MTRTIDAIDALVTNLLARVNQPDGTGLKDSSQATINQIRADIAGLRTTLNQAVLGMESDRQQLRADLEALTILVNNHLGVS